jgi:hypothetical protein
MRISIGRPLGLASALLATALLLPAAAGANVFSELDEPATIESGPTISIATDKADYAPGELVTVTGSGWQPGENVALSVVDDGVAEERWQYDSVVAADENGDIVDRFNIAEWYVAQYFVTATGEVSGVATTSFTDTMGDYREGTAAVGGTVACANPTNVLTSDDLRATCDRNSADPADSVIVSGFNLQSVVPSGAANIRFNVEVEAIKGGGGGDRAVNLALSHNGGTNFTTTTTNTGTFAPGADQVRTFPTTNPANCDDFGRTWAYSELSDASFRVRAMPAGATQATAFIDIDRIRVRVCYDGSNITEAAAAAQLSAVASPSATVQASLRLHLQGTSAPDWEGTTYQFDSGPESPCVNTTDEAGTAAGNRTPHDFPMTVPAAPGTYDVTFRAYPDDNCTEPLVIQPFTLADGLTVGIFGDSFGINTADNNYDDNGWSDEDGSGQDCRVESIAGVGVIDNHRYLRLRSDCEQTRSGINTTGLTNIHLKYRWGQDTTIASPGNLTVQWKKSSDGAWSPVNTHSLPNSGGVATIPNSVDFALPASANNTSIDIRFIGPTPASNPDTQRALVDDVLVTGDPFAVVSGTKFNDLNHDGSRDADGADNAPGGGDDEVGLQNWTIRAFADNGAGAGNPGDGVLHADEVTPGAAATALTDANGLYTLQLAAGAYVVCETQQAGWAQSAPINAKCQAVDANAPGGHAVTAVVGTPVTDQNFGNFQPATVSGTKFNDLNHDGSRDADGVNDTGGDSDDEVGLSGWVIKAYAAGADGALDGTEAAAAAVATDTTDGTGAYSLDLPSGKYVICEELVSGWRQSAPSNTNCDLVDDPVAKGGHAVDLDPNEDVIGQDFGNFELATVTGLKFDDVDHNGTNAADPADPAAPGWTINVFADDGNGTLSTGEAGAPPVATDVTDSNGVYSFELPSGTYVICEELQNDWRQSTPSNSACDEVSLAASGGHAVDLDPNEDVNSGVDFGNFHLATVRGLKFNDFNHDGVRDDDGADDAPGGGDDEEPLDSWVIQAYADGADGGVGVLSATEAAALPVVQTQTNGSGNYTIKLPSGTYVICEELESGWRQSAPSNAKCDAVDEPVAKGGHAVDLDPGEEVNNQDFGNFELATVSGIKFNDLNHDGSRDADGLDDAPGGGDDEVPLDGWTIEAYADDGDGVLDSSEGGAAAAASTTTALDGTFGLELPSGTYVICEQLEADWAQSAPDPADAECKEASDAHGGHAVDLDPNEDVAGKDFGNYQPATVSGIKFDDLNHDGSRDADGADNAPGGGDDEVPLDGWTIEAYADGGDGALSDTEGDEPPVASDVTDSNGAYQLTLPSGTYVVCEQLQSDWAQSYPDPADKECTEVDGAATGGHAVDLDPNEDLGDKDFGNYRPATVSGIKFNDLNHDGSRDADGADNAPGGGDDEEPLSGWVIKAYAAGTDGALDGTEAAAAAAGEDTTDGNGAYSIALPSGKYVICEELQNGYAQSKPANSQCDLVADPVAKGGHPVDLDPNEDLGDQDFGNYQPATVSGTKFNDLNHDGSRDADGADNAPGGGDDEVGLSGWVIKAYAAGTDGALDGTEAAAAAVASDTTDGNGAYSLDLPSGKYVICEELVADWTQSAPSNTNCDLVDDPVAKGGHAVDLDPNEAVTAKDFGNFQKGSVSGIKFNDLNHDASRDADGVNNSGGDSDDEVPLNNWVIKAYAAGADGVLDSTEAAAAPAGQDTTDSNGAYTIDLPSGKYVICEELQSGWTQSTPVNSYCDLVDDPVAKGGHAVNVAPDQDITGKDFGNYQPGSVAGIKFDDRDKDGTKASGEPVLGGWVIKAYADGGDGVLSVAEAGVAAVDTDTTASDGTYALDLPSGKYVVCEELVSGWRQSAPSGTACANLANPAADGGYAVDVDPDEDITAKDFGNYRRATVTVRKTYSDGTTMTTVNVKLECTNGFSETKPSTPGSPGSPAVFTVDGFAAGDTCEVTEVGSPAGWTPDTSGCAITLTAGGAHECTVMNVPEATIVTAGGCTFDRDTSRQGFQFPLIFTPETGGYSKLNATNPGQFFLNVAYDGDEGDDIDIYVPFPFVLHGTNPIKVHSDVAVTNTGGKTCYSPAGTLLSSPSGQVTWNYGPGGDTFGNTKKITVEAPEDGLVYVRIHMTYGLKGLAGSCARGTTSPPQATCQSPRANLLIGDAPTVGYEQYQFSFNGPNDSGGGKVESYNEFKKNPGIGGLVASTSTGLPFTNAKADIYQGNSKVGTVYTDADGWYMWTYKYTGKAATFTVKLPNNGNAQQSATLKSNGYLSINFALP